MADAAGNDLIRVRPNGDAVTVARWPVEVIGTDNVGDPGLPPFLPAEAVPTAVAIGPDGWAYVGQLMGFPGKPGTAHIWRVNPNAEGAVCSVYVADPDCSVWKSGFTSIFDIAFNPHNGTLYVYEIAPDGWLTFEAGFVPAFSRRRCCWRSRATRPRNSCLASSHSLAGSRSATTARCS